MSAVAFGLIKKRVQVSPKGLGGEGEVQEAGWGDMDTRQFRKRLEVLGEFLGEFQGIPFCNFSPGERGAERQVRLDMRRRLGKFRLQSGLLLNAVF